MKTTLTLIALVLFSASTLLADDTKILPAPKVGDVTFTHKKHQELLKGCAPCHATAAGGKIENLSKKDDAHNLCKGCHETKKKGPVKCGECHKKNK
jgi:predicted CXXCH cytochrome family protein